jgi:predicted dehydrogenase
VDTIRWGILSTARIATETVIPAMQASSTRGEALAIASRDQETAETAAARLGIPRAYGSYEELLDDPDIDAIYIPLPNHLHVPWSVRALEAGKHVLCEKPLARNVAEAMILVEAGRRHPELKVMEAFMYKFHPQWQKVRSLIQEGAIGELRTVATIFAYFLDDGGNIRNMAAIGGGGLLDIGCYAISVPRFLFNAEPVRLVATLEFDGRFETDRLDSAILEFWTPSSALPYTGPPDPLKWRFPSMRRRIARASCSTAMEESWTRSCSTPAISMRCKPMRLLRPFSGTNPFRFPWMTRWPT